jgi:hypothetical protein
MCPLQALNVSDRFAETHDVSASSQSWVLEWAPPDFNPCGQPIETFHPRLGLPRVDVTESSRNHWSFLRIETVAQESAERPRSVTGF